MMTMDNYRITNEMSVASYTLDLKDIQKQKSISIIVARYNIESPVRRRIVSSTPTWEMNLELAVEVSPELKIRDKSKLLVITGVEQSGNKITIKQTTPNCPIAIQLNHEEIVDCEQPGAIGQYYIRYTLKSQYIEYSGLFNRRHECEWHSQNSEELQIEFKEILAEPICSVVPVTEESSPAYNIAEEKVLVGNLKLKHNQTKYASAPLQGKFDLGLSKERIYNDLLILDLDGLRVENPYCEFGGGANLQDKNRKDRNYAFAITCENGVYMYEGLYPKEEVTIPIYLKLRDTDLRNPIEDFDTYKIVVNPQKYYSYQYIKSGNMVTRKETRCSIKNEEFEFKLFKDKSILESALFLVTTQAGCEVATHWPLENDDNNKYYTSILPKFKIIANGIFQHSYKLKIKNLAGNQDDNAAVVVRDFKVTGINCKDAGVLLLDNNGKSVSLLGDVFTVSSCNNFVQLRASQACDIVVTFNPQVIAKMTNGTGQDCFSSVVELHFSYSYYELEAGRDIDSIDSDYNVVSGLLRFQLEMAPNVEWLCLDYGTSAVVAAYGEIDVNSHATDILCDLRSAKAKLLRIGGVPEERRKTNDEAGTKFISSLIALNHFATTTKWNEIRVATEYEDSYLWFSPADGMVDYNYVYPCLKSLMGYDKVPTTLFPNDNEVLQDTGLERVDNLYPIVYKQMFEYYMPVDKGEIHKLVMSVPNTFAPIHLEKLAAIARDSLPNLREDKLLFVSESDAIAYNYINRRAAIINSNKQHLVGIEDDFDKRVLVYDMGAGTLDLTYFVKSQEVATTGAIQGLSITVDIQGKIGVSKSGNYVDYLVAEIIADLMRSSGRYEDSLCELYEQLLNLKRTHLSGGQNSVRIALKQFVKENVKHRLNNVTEKLGVFEAKDNKSDNNGENSVGSMNIDLSQFTINDIISHPKFTAFVMSVTNELFDTFAAQCGDENGNLVADLVIFSGRASSLNIVRKSVMNYFESKNKDCKFLDIATQEFVTPNNMSTPQAINGLKEAVVEGAMVYATSFVDNPLNKIIDKNIYATYGLMLNIGNNQWYWQPMIDAKTKPVGTFKKLGRTISTYDSSEWCCADGIKDFSLDFRTINHCYIVQTYDSKNALQNWMDNRREMITVLGRIPGSELQQYRGLGSIPVVMKVSEENRIELHISGGSIAVLPHDDFEDTSFRKSMWPIIWG